jgi:hypothetical protein
MFSMFRWSHNFFYNVGVIVGVANNKVLLNCQAVDSGGLPDSTLAAWLIPTLPSQKARLQVCGLSKYHSHLLVTGIETPSVKLSNAK